MARTKTHKPSAAGKAMRRWREKNELSREELADLLGCSANWVYRLEEEGRRPRGPLAKLIEEKTGVREGRWP